MKKLVVLSLAVMVLVAASSMAAVVTKGKMTYDASKDGPSYPVVKGGKGLTGFQAIGPMGYADAWRTIASYQGKSIFASPSGDSVCILYSQYSGNVGTESNVKFAFTVDGAASWTHYDVVSDRNVRTYSAMAMAPDFTPILVWQDRLGGAPWSILLTYDEMGFGGGLWATNVHLTDSAAFYLPGAACGANGTYAACAFPHAGFGYDQTMYQVIGTGAGASGITWTSPWDLSGTWGWNPWIDSPNDDQDAFKYVISPDGNTIVGMSDEFWPTAGAVTNGYAPTITWSTDGGVNWPTSSGPEKFYLFGNDTLPPDGMGGMWWYRWDGVWLNGKPHFVYQLDDAGYNGGYLVHTTPAVVGDYTNWVHTIVNPPLPTDRYGLGLGVDWSSMSTDAAGNLYVNYITWNDGTAAGPKDIWCVVSEDDGATWHKPYKLTDGTQNISWLEGADFAGGDMIHFIACHYNLMDTLYYGTIPTASVLAQPMHDPLTEAVLPIQWGRPVSDPVIDTINSANNPGDTIDFIWSWNTLRLQGKYHIQVSADEAFTSPYTWGTGDLQVNYFDRSANPWAPVNIGLPFNGMVYWRVRIETPAKAIGAWSEVWRFVYEGGTLNTTDWVADGVTGNPTLPTIGTFALNQNRPNPVTRSAEISFNLPKAGAYSLRIYNVAGQTVKEFNGYGHAGANSINWNVGSATNGVYFYKLTSGGNTATKKLVVVK